MQTELTSLKGQLTTSRDQNDKSATTITELRKQLDDGARHLEELRSKGSTSEDVARMTRENDLLRGIVMRQLKDQARRMQARDLLNDELKRLEVQSDTLNKQVEELGRPDDAAHRPGTRPVQGPAGDDLGFRQQPGVGRGGDFRGQGPCARCVSYGQPCW